MKKSIAQLHLPERIIIAVVLRNHKALVPKGNLVLREGDMVILYSEVKIANAEEIEI